MPRTASIEVAEKAIGGTVPLAVNSWMISALWRWPVGLNERITPLRSGWCEAAPVSPPTPDEPVLASTTVGMAVSTTPARKSG